MANKIQIRRGLQAGVDKLVLDQGEFAVALDTGNVYIGLSSGKAWLNPPGGDADTAVALKNPREFSISGDGNSPVVAFDGSQNVNLTLTLATIAGLTAGTYTKVAVDTKGRVTGGMQLEVTDLPTIPSSKISGLGTAATKNVGSASGNVVQVGSDGKIPSSVLPDLAITDTFVAESQTEMLALTAQRGDICIRSDVGKTFILKTDEIGRAHV